MVSFSPRNRSAVRASSRTCRTAYVAAAVASSRRPKPGLDGEKSPTPGVCGPDSVGWPAAIQAAIPPSSTRTSRKPRCLNIHQSRLAGRDAQSSYATTGRDMVTPPDRIAAVKVSTVGMGWRPPTPSGRIVASTVSMSTYAAPGTCARSKSSRPVDSPSRKRTSRTTGRPVSGPARSCWSSSTWIRGDAFIASSVEVAALWRRGQCRVALHHRCQDVVDRGQQSGVELDPGCIGILDDLFGPRGADDRRGHVGILQNPCDSQLRHREAGLLRQWGQLLDGGEHRVLEPPADHVGATVLVGGTGSGWWSLTRLVLAGQHSLGDGRPYDLPDPELLRGWNHFALDDSPEHVVLRLVGDKGDPQLSGQTVALAQLSCVPLRDTDVQRFALANDVGKRLHRLLQWCLVVESMRLVQVHVVGAKATQGAVDGLMDVFAGQAMVVLPGLPHREIDLGEDLQTFASLALQRLTQDGLGLGFGVGIGGVERGDADVQGLSHARERLFLFDLRPVGQPVAVCDLGYPQSTVAKVPEFHPTSLGIRVAVSYTHLTLPTMLRV